MQKQERPEQVAPGVEGVRGWSPRWCCGYWSLSCMLEELSVTRVLF